MDNYFWVTTRTIKPGPREHFEHAWRPASSRQGRWGPTCSTPTTAMRSWASRSGTPPKRVTATATGRRGPPAGPHGPLRTRGAIALRHRARAGRPGALKSPTSPLPLPDEQRSAAGIEAPLAIELDDPERRSTRRAPDAIRCSSQGASVSTPLRRAPAWDDGRASQAIFRRRPLGTASTSPRLGVLIGAGDGSVPHLTEPSRRCGQ
jgi:hypothetical protein